MHGCGASGRACSPPTTWCWPSLSAMPRVFGRRAAGRWSSPAKPASTCRCRKRRSTPPPGWRKAGGWAPGAGRCSRWPAPSRARRRSGSTRWRRCTNAAAQAQAPRHCSYWYPAARNVSRPLHSSCRRDAGASCAAASAWTYHCVRSWHPPRAARPKLPVATRRLICCWATRLARCSSTSCWPTWWRWVDPSCPPARTT